MRSCPPPLDFLSPQPAIMSAPATLTKKQQKASKHHSSASAAASTSTLPASTSAAGNEEAVTDPLSLLPRGKKTKNKRKLARDEKAGEDVIGDEDDEVMGEEQEEKRVIKKMKTAAGAAGEGAKATKVEGAAVEGGEKKKGTPGEKGKPKTKARFILFVGESLSLGVESSGGGEGRRRRAHTFVLPFSFPKATSLSPRPDLRSPPSSRSTSNSSLPSVSSRQSPTRTRRARRRREESREESRSSSEYLSSPSAVASQLCFRK